MILIRAGQCHTCFSKFVPLRQLFDNHDTVGREIITLHQLEYQIGTDISTLYQTEHQIAAATLKTRFSFVNAVDRDIIKVLKYLCLVFLWTAVNVRQINVILTCTFLFLACKSTWNSITYKDEKTTNNRQL